MKYGEQISGIQMILVNIELIPSWVTGYAATPERHRFPSCRCDAVPANALQKNSGSLKPLNSIKSLCLGNLNHPIYLSSIQKFQHVWKCHITHVS